MSSLKSLILFNIAQFNRIRRKPLREILTFLAKRTGQATVHLRDRLHMMILGEIELTDEEFFHKLSLKDPAVSHLRKTIAQGDWEGAKKETVAHMKIRETPIFFFEWKDRKKMQTILAENFPQSEKRTRQLADEAVNHHFNLLGEKVHFEGPIDWHSTVSCSRRWPLSFSPSIDYISFNRVGDIKLAWELNRTQHFVTLGKAYWNTCDEKYGAEFADQLSSWIEENPYKKGINWMEGIEVAIRLISWVWAYHFFLNSKEFNIEGHFEFLKSVYLQTRFIEEHLSDKWTINGNHLIAEATTLAMIGILFPEFGESRNWIRKGIAIVEKELNAQILPDGVTWEQSTGYQKFVTDLCLMLVVLMVKNEMKIPKGILSKLNQMIDFLNSIARIDGRLPLVGDEDQGRVVTIGGTGYDDVRSTITVGSILLNRTDWMKTKSEEAFWFLGEEGLVKESRVVTPTSTVFEDSGFIAMRDKEKYVLLTVGPQNPKYLHASHRHLDMLSFVLSAYGTCFITDPGTYTYLGDFKWRRYFRSMKAHNTVVVDDKDPVDIEEVFELSHIPYASIQDSASDNRFDWATLRHNGYKSVTHIREVFFKKPEYWIILDLLQSDTRHIYDLYFHFDHGLDLTYDPASQSVTARSSTGNLKIILLMTPGSNLEILDGEVSPSYGFKTKAPILRHRKRGEKTSTFTTVLCPYRNEEPKIKISQIDVYGKDNRILDKNVATGVRIDFGEHEDYLVCSHGAEQLCLLLGDFPERRGKVVFLRKEESGSVEEIVF